MGTPCQRFCRKPPRVMMSAAAKCPVRGCTSMRAHPLHPCWLACGRMRGSGEEKLRLRSASVGLQSTPGTWRIFQKLVVYIRAAPLGFSGRTAGDGQLTRQEGRAARGRGRPCPRGPSSGPGPRWGSPRAWTHNNDLTLSVSDCASLLGRECWCMVLQRRLGSLLRVSHQESSSKPPVSSASRLPCVAACR